MQTNMNIERMEILRDDLRAGHEGFAFRMDVVMSCCRTAGCIAGHAIALYQPTMAPDCSLAGKLLGLTPEQSENLFTPFHEEMMRAQVSEPESGVSVGMWEDMLIVLPGNLKDRSFFSAERAADAVDLMINGDNNPWMTLALRDAFHATMFDAQPEQKVAA